jgi:alpha-tubulin suppressor-like RCC1 family protein
VFSFGKGTHGRLGQGNDLNKYEPILIEGLAEETVTSISAGCRHAGAITKEGRLFMWGFNFYDQLGIEEAERDMDHPVLVNQVSGARSISCGYFHSGALVDHDL